MAGMEVAPFSPQDNSTITLAFNAMEKDSSIPRDVLSKLRGVLEAEETGEGIKVTLSNIKKVNQEVLSHTTSEYDILALKGTDQTYYVRPAQDGFPLSDIYEPIDREEFTNIVTRTYKRLTGVVDGAAIEKVCDSLDKQIRAERTIPRVDNTIIQVIPDRFWNTSTGDLSDRLYSGELCFRRLFNTTKPSRHIVKYKDGTFEGYKDILDEYVDETFAELTLSKGDLEEDPDFEFVQTWACGDHGRYMDILRMFATFFMKEKPLGNLP